MSNRPRSDLKRRSFLQGALLTAGSNSADIQSLMKPIVSQTASPQILEVIARDEADLYYRFTVDGNVEMTQTSETVAAGGNDTIVTGTDTSTKTVRGYTGNPGYGDAYEIFGEIRSFEQTGGSRDRKSVV